MNEYQNIINNKKISAAKKSLYAAVFITFIKILAAYFSNSLAVLSEVFHSAIDILACSVTILSIKFGSKPPDDTHNYGHEKAESFAALFQVIILLIMCSYIFYEGAARLFLGKHAEVNITIWTFAVIIISIFIDISRSRALMKTAKETNSRALEADALHFSSDILTSGIVLVSMIITYFNLFEDADSYTAMLVSVIIIIIGLKLSKKAIDSLMDKVPAGLADTIKEAAKKVNGVEDIKSFRIRETGARIFVDMTITISRLAQFSKAHSIVSRVEREILDLVPGADVIIQSEPVETSNESINEKIRMIVSEHGLKCHDIFSHKIKDKVITELHVEIDETNDLVKAHELVTLLENEIKEKISIISDVRIHIDEPSEILFETEDVTQKSNDIIGMIIELLKKESGIQEYKDINIVSTNGKLRISLTCCFKADYSFEQVHDKVTLLESKIYLHLKEYYPNIANVIIHAEPEIILK